MDLLGSVLDFILHVDAHLQTFVRAYGAWVYALLFAIVFIETGVVVMPFLPGDSLLFVVGAMCAAGLMSLPLALVLLWIAAVLGNQSNYAIGRAIGPRVFQWEDSRWFNRKAFDQAHAFYEKYGGVTIIAARHAVSAHLRPVRGRRRGHVPASLHALRHDRRRALDRLGDAQRLSLRQHPVGQGQPREVHLGRDPRSWPARGHRGMASADEAVGEAGLSRAVTRAAGSEAACAELRAGLDAESTCDVTGQASCW